MTRLRKAIRTEAKPLIGFYAESGGGKTKSGLLLAKGFCGDMAKVAMIETEAGRGEVWAEDPEVGGYNVLSIRNSFSPAEYGNAISEAEAAKVQVLMIDSASHEWEGVGGVLAMAAANQEAGKKGPIVWQKPKMEHKREFMLRLQQTPIPLIIVCMRAKYPMMEKKSASGAKEWVRSDQLEPIQAEDILYDMFIHGWMDKETHSFHGTKYTVETLKSVFVNGEPISIATGQRLAAWSKGSAAPQPALPTSSSSGVPTAEAAFLSVDQVTALEDELTTNGKSKDKLLANVSRRYGRTLTRLAEIQAADYSEAIAYARRP